MNRARAAWQKGDFDVAEPLYKEAIDTGGLGPEEVVDAWVHLGAARVVMGQMKPAAEAFRRAAVLDPKFQVPPEAGKRAVQLGEMVRRQTRIGPIALAMGDVPSVKAGQGFGVDATLDAAHVPFVAKIGFFARDPLTQKSFADSAAAAPTVHFDVPGKIALPGATLVVRIDALDAHDNRLASTEKRVQVETAVVTKSDPAVVTKKDDEPPKKEEKKSGGFWSSPWPYVIGGVVLAGAGGATWYFTRQTDDVSVASPRVVR